MLRCLCNVWIPGCSSAKTARKREELTFEDDDEDDLLDHLNLGLDDDKEMPKKKKETQKTRY